MDNRKEQIRQEILNRYPAFDEDLKPCSTNGQKAIGFIEGVDWAEKHPSDYLIDKIMFLVMATDKNPSLKTIKEKECWISSQFMLENE